MGVVIEMEREREGGGGIIMLQLGYMTSFHIVNLFSRQ